MLTDGDIYDAAYIDKGLGTNEWHSVDNNDPDEQAMVICQIQGKYKVLMHRINPKETDLIVSNTSSD